MSLKIPKTGLAKRLREWMSGQSRSFCKDKLCAAFPEIARARINSAISDCLRRKELIPVTKYNRRQYLYNRDWKKAIKGALNKKIYKAMYVSGQFVAADIERLAGVKDTGWVRKLLSKLKKAGLVQQIGRRACAHGAGAEAIWHVSDRDKFKIETKI